MTPRIIPGTDRQMQVCAYPSATYKHSGDRIAGRADGIESVRQAIRHILMTERYAYPIYPDSYGVELEQYIGREISYLKATIEETLKDALLQDDRIVSVSVISVERSDEPNDAMVTFAAETIYGEIKLGVSVDV